MKLLLLCLVLAGLSACVSPAPKKYGAGPKIGKPYQQFGQWYYPREDPEYDEVGEASWYGPGFQGKKTASGEPFDKYDMTAAHPTLPLPSMVRVTNLSNGKSVKLRINDRGPFKSGRIIDVSKKAADELGFRLQGIARVRVQFLKEETSALFDRPLDYVGKPTTPAQMVPRTSTGSVTLTKQQVEARNLPKTLPPKPDANRSDQVMQSLEKEYSQMMAAKNHYVQVVSFASKQAAEEAAKAMLHLGDVYISHLKRGEESSYRLRLGAYTNEIEARKALAAIQALGYPNAALVLD